VLGTPDYDRYEWIILEWFYSRLAPGAYADEHVTHYTRKTLTEVLEARGYKVMDHGYVGRGELILKAQKPGPDSPPASDGR